MPPKQVRAREMASQAIPPVPIGPHQTTSNALHRIKFLGELHRWPNFFRGIESYIQSTRWSTKAIKYTHTSGNPEAESHLIVDEAGLQGLFNHSIGYLVGKILEVQSIDLQFADFRCLGSQYAKTPDSILMTTNTATPELKMLGELKVWWIEEHDLVEAYGNESALRRLLAQPIQYMKDLNCMYGFMSNYQQTIFLRQQFICGKWVVDYSPVILASTSYIKTDLGDFLATPIVSLRQCFLAIAHQAQTQGPVSNLTPNWQWVM
ncbi:hypothetical protein POX_e06357 [Penicillium oxalicum]|uniref:hypothetical protein n=1 Tax=Penicillium oxalicum TaxID=69781 RepID=UPI0020B63EEE|nr:hypothetical protein POX_e06357 [Penicillium oxalicum]KAI2788343.1 hypothetical protein POX_e06357 [Penicillium oxalicum]